MNDIVKAELLRELVNQVKAMRAELADVKEHQMEIKKLLSNRKPKEEKNG